MFAKTDVKHRAQTQCMKCQTVGVKFYGLSNNGTLLLFGCDHCGQTYEASAETGSVFELTEHGEN